MDYYEKEKKSIYHLLIIFFVGIALLISLSYALETNMESDCSGVLVSGDSNNVNMVFLPNNYNSLLEFKSDVNSYVDRNALHNGLLSVEPFKSNWYMFNFYSVDLLRGLDCATGKDYLLCNNIEAKRLASTCPHDYIIVLNKHNIFDDSAYLRSSAYSGVASINTADNRLVLTHEFGHLFGDLADEYITGENLDFDPLNCDIATCPKWYGRFDGVGCFQGCTTINLFRSTENSIMRDYSKSSDFGPVNEDILLRRFL